MKFNHPTEIPLSKSLFFDWIGERIPASDPNVAGDTHPQTWADDNEIYVGTGDPNWYERDGVKFHHSMQGVNNGLGYKHTLMSGQAAERLTGDPETFGLERVHDMPGYVGWGGHGPKPCGMVCVDGVLYYAVQNLLGMKPCPHRAGSQHGSDATIIRSKDHGKTWEPDLNGILGGFYDTYYDGANGGSWKIPAEERTEHMGWSPMFPGSEFGGLSFVQFGKDNAGALDGYVYAISGDQWDNGRFLRLGRVPKDRIMERDAWEFHIPKDGRPTWIKGLKDSAPILDIEGFISLPEMVYIPALRKYILLTWNLHTDFYTPTGSGLTVLESDDIWGPFSLVHYEWMWEKREVCAYTPRIPLKWFDNDKLEGYMLHSGNWGFTGNDGQWKSFPQYYRPHVRKFRFTRRNDPKRRS